MERLMTRSDVREIVATGGLVDAEICIAQVEQQVGRAAAAPLLDELRRLHEGTVEYD